MTDRDLPLFARIDVAIARVEAGLSRRSGLRTDADYAHLAARHEALRAEILGAIEELATVGTMAKLDR